jgi:hypothetical protein
VIANDTGGGLVLTSLADTALDTTRIARLVLTNCDSYEHFSPGSFARIVKLCRLSSAAGGVVLRLLASEAGQRFFLKAVFTQPPTPQRQREIFGAFATDSAARRDAVAVTASLDPALTLGQQRRSRTSTSRSPWCGAPMTHCSPLLTAAGCATPFHALLSPWSRTAPPSSCSTLLRNSPPRSAPHDHRRSTTVALRRSWAICSGTTNFLSMRSKTALAQWQ